MRPIRRLLIANRGEIAVRIARAAHERGLVVLGVYSDADANALFRRELDESVRIGPGPATESYLDIDRIVAAAKTLRADAIHPGYGFLSERAPFAQAVIDAGMRFVGPSAAAIAAMGSKIDAKRRVREAGVPVVPGYDGDDQRAERLRAEAEAIGTPVLIKASAGGGGRGMRVVDDLAAFEDALASAKREALAAFGDDAVLLERYLRRPRHIEFQILADEHGTTVHLGERECSIQRRHQKVIEEAPSVALDDSLRAAMGDAAVRAARSVGYTNAGTAEFMLDTDGSFYFLEMNARLQVEHPVTELVYGVDLVALQLAVADGERLPFTQEALRPRGWAIEARLNAEDPAHDYRPSAGRIDEFSVPHAPGLRVDTGVRSGSTVSVFYDSMLAKIIAWGPSRPSAIERLRGALGETEVRPLATSLPLLRAILDDEAFAAGDLSTRFLEERDLTGTSHGASREALLLAAAALAAGEGAWRLGGVGIPIALDVDGMEVRAVARRRSDGSYAFSGDLEASVRVEAQGASVAVAGDGIAAEGTAVVEGDGVDVVVAGRARRFRFPEPPSSDAAHTHGGVASGDVQAPMPGKIVSVAVRAGETVTDRALLVVLEAMKMEHRIEAPLAGTVKAVHVSPGTLVSAGTTLVTIE